MIIGNGDIASVLPDRKDFIFFASGVSNSKEKSIKAFNREKNLLLNQDFTKHIVYFSSLAIYYSDTYYTRHKMRMEELVKGHFRSRTIVRLGNITWGKNPYTLINYLKAHPKAKIKDVYRYICDKEEFLYWINMIPNWNTEMNIPGRRMKVVDIIKEYGNTK